MISRTTFSTQPVTSSDRADPFDLAQAGRVGLDDVEYGFAVDEALIVGRADAADYAGAEVALDAVERRRCGRVQKAGPELEARGSVVRPGPRGFYPLASRDYGGVADHRDEVASPARLQSKEAEAILLAGERRALDKAGEVLGWGGRGWGGGDAHALHRKWAGWTEAPPSSSSIQPSGSSLPNEETATTVVTGVRRGGWRRGPSRQGQSCRPRDRFGSALNLSHLDAQSWRPGRIRSKGFVGPTCIDGGQKQRDGRQKPPPASGEGDREQRPRPREA